MGIHARVAFQVRRAIPILARLKSRLWHCVVPDPPALWLATASSNETAQPRQQLLTVRGSERVCCMGMSGVLLDNLLITISFLD
jgi:hypothetical protein